VGPPQQAHRQRLQRRQPSLACGTLGPVSCRPPQKVQQQQASLGGSGTPGSCRARPKGAANPTLEAGRWRRELHTHPNALPVWGFTRSPLTQPLYPSQSPHRLNGSPLLLNPQLARKPSTLQTLGRHRWRRSQQEGRLRKGALLRGRSRKQGGGRWVGDRNGRCRGRGGAPVHSCSSAT